MDVTLWHNPRCSKSRAALALLEEHGATLTLRRYLDDAPSLEELQAAQAALGLSAIDMMRSKEPAFKALGLSKDMPDATLLAAMAQEPKLIERPIAFVGDKAVIGRPPDRVLKLL